MAVETRSKRERHAAKNQSLFREVNERVRDMNSKTDLLLELSDWVCECADETCMARIQLTPREYEHIREYPTHFAVAPGHVVPDVETVVDRQAGFWIVEKIGEAADVAEELDPRSRTDR